MDFLNAIIGVIQSNIEQYLHWGPGEHSCVYVPSDLTPRL